MGPWNGRFIEPQCGDSRAMSYSAINTGRLGQDKQRTVFMVAKPSESKLAGLTTRTGMF